MDESTEMGDVDGETSTIFWGWSVYDVRASGLSVPGDCWLGELGEDASRSRLGRKPVEYRSGLWFGLLAGDTLFRFPMMTSFRARKTPRFSFSTGMSGWAAMPVGGPFVSAVISCEGPASLA